MIIRGHILALALVEHSAQAVGLELTSRSMHQAFGKSSCSRGEHNVDGMVKWRRLEGDRFFCLRLPLGVMLNATEEVIQWSEGWREVRRR